jgi:hypothetical protein
MSVNPEPEPGRPTSRPTAGIDWASEEHAVSIVDPGGVELERFTVGHTAVGLRRLPGRLQRAGVAEVGIERPDGPVVDALLGAGLTVFVIAPNRLKSLRGRYGSAGNKDDSFDAFVLADTVRTDRARLRPLTPDSAATVTLRMTVRARQDLPRPGSRWATSCGPTCRPPCRPPRPARSDCSATSTATSPCRSCAASPARTRPTGSRWPGWRSGCVGPATTT